MHLLGLLIFGAAALFWLTCGIRAVLGMLRQPWLKDFPPAEDTDCPRISLLFAARDEEEKLPAALKTMLELDYPNLEIIAADDRSTDATRRILDGFAAAYPRLRVVHISNLPEGWLGKPHALQKAYEHSTGEWLLFTDADVHFRADTLRRAVSLIRAQQLDHLTLMCDVEMAGFWEKVLVTFFGFGFQIIVNPASVSNPKSKAYAGVGAFQMVRRSAYEASGTHQRLAMEVVDDMKLGKIVKEAGFRSLAAAGRKFVAVRWYSGFWNMVHGLTKNFFAAGGYRLDRVFVQILATTWVDILPWVALPFVHGWSLALAAFSVGVAIVFHAGVAIVMRASPLFAFTHPVGAAVFNYMLTRSTRVTLRQGGVMWRGTFYPLEKLRRGVV